MLGKHLYTETLGIVRQVISAQSWTLHENIQDTAALGRGCALLNSWFIEITASNPGYYSRIGQEEKG